MSHTASNLRRHRNLSTPTAIPVLIDREIQYHERFQSALRIDHLVVRLELNEPTQPLDPGITPPWLQGAVLHPLLTFQWGSVFVCLESVLTKFGEDPGH